MCFNIREIAYGDHLRWLKQNLKRKDMFLYIAENANGKKIGQVRFQSNGESAYINVNLNPHFLGGD